MRLNQQHCYRPLYQEYAVSRWLFGVAGMVFLMVVIGGLTRLTGSGLSMVTWHPVSGWLPPLNEADWISVFEGYKQIPEYTEINAGMTLSEYKGIFWLEYSHRLWGRLIGLVYVVPLVFFLIKGWIPRTLLPMLFFLLLLGVAQGVMGWYMVQSGLVERVDVSQYRLAAHLVLAVVIFILTLRLAFRVRLGYEAVMPILPKGVRRTRTGLLVLGALVFMTIVSGAFVAGLDAGLIYNTFPMMDGRIVPKGVYALDPWYLSAFEDVTTVQFNHRAVAIFTVVCTILFWWMSPRKVLNRRQQQSYLMVLGAVCLQAGLGISTVLLVVPVPLAALHQAGALVVLTSIVYGVHVMEWGNSVFDVP